jgi:hypothetical protein
MQPMQDRWQQLANQVQQQAPSGVSQDVWNNFLQYLKTMQQQNNASV